MDESIIFINTMKEQILNAIAVHNVSQYHHAKTNLDNYLIWCMHNHLANPAAIGEHPDIVTEAIKLVETMEAAESNLQTLNAAYGTDYTTAI
tara:strand:- start:1074 stop:1349 length:276 start_codon:yes stop_codon:yes gene_type:complete